MGILKCSVAITLALAATPALADEFFAVTPSFWGSKIEAAKGDPKRLILADTVQA